jgi:hypothetical protein
MRRVTLARVFGALRALARRPGWVAVLLIGLLGSSALVVWGALHSQDGVANAALNLGTGGLGAILTVAIIGPVLRYVQEGTVREHDRLDYAWFTSQLADVTQQIQILTTFSNLLDNSVTDRFLRAVRGALARQARVEILLLNPGSLAADVRQQELSGVSVRLNVQREIMRNLRRLASFAAELPESQRQYFEVRLYDASASITLYRWDDRALVSFLPIGRFSEFGAQLEVTTRSPLGEFLEQRFLDLWENPGTLALDEFTQVAVTLVEDEHTARSFRTRFVVHQDLHYVVHTEVLAAMARRPERLFAFLRGEASRLHELVIVDGQDPELHGALDAAFVEKYDAHAHAFVGLRPLAS